MSAWLSFFEILLVLVLPPLGLFVSGNNKNIPGDELLFDVCINVLFTLLGILPGIIHGLIVWTQYNAQYQEERAALILVKGDLVFEACICQKNPCECKDYELNRKTEASSTLKPTEIKPTRNYQMGA